MLFSLHVFGEDRLKNIFYIPITYSLSATKVFLLTLCKPSSDTRLTAYIMRTLSFIFWEEILLFAILSPFWTSNFIVFVTYAYECYGPLSNSSTLTYCEHSNKGGVVSSNPLLKSIWQIFAPLLLSLPKRAMIIITKKQ
jgi:hypothetical protein